jgi:hypothetical protein
VTEFFPRRSIAWTLEEPAAFRRLSLSLPQMALVTGLCLRLWRSYTFTHGAPDSYLWVGSTFLVGMTFLFLMLTLHIGNYTLRNWLWRAPLFAVLESGTEIVVSLALTTLGLEPLGAQMAEMSDWLPTAGRVLIVRVVGILLFTLVLAIVVSIVRRILLANEGRTSTAVRISRASVEQQLPRDP